MTVNHIVDTLPQLASFIAGAQWCTPAVEVRFIFSGFTALLMYIYILCFRFQSFGAEKKNTSFHFHLF